MKTELEKLLTERDKLREKEFVAYTARVSRAKRLRFTQSINDLNARIEALRQSIKTKATT